jgi:hypothetical protein
MTYKTKEYIVAIILLVAIFIAIPLLLTFLVLAFFHSTII